MTSASVLFEPGWTHQKSQPSGLVDEKTHEPLPPIKIQTLGRGLIQSSVWTGMTETTATAVSDERLVLFAPPIEVTSADEFYSPDGHCWQAISDGLPRGIPNKQPEYVAARVRRAKEKDQHG